MRRIRASSASEYSRNRYARFNPPWTPWFARRNEVVLPVEE